jgi:hypothetical protein
MHFEVPRSKSFKEFGGEYLMIVISILTALALEGVVEKVHHNHLAHEASDQIDAELRANVSSLKEALANNEQEETALTQVREQMLAALQAHVDDAAFMRRFEQEWHTSIKMNIREPMLRREAWEAAVANQAVTWMPHDKLEQYAGAYAATRDVSALINGGAVSFLDGPRMQDTFSDVRMGIGNPRDIFRIVTQMINAYGSLDGNMRSLRGRLEKAGSTGEQGKP